MARTKIRGSAQVQAGTIDTAELADNGVTAAKILAGVVVNSHINASANIAFSKLDVTGADFDSSGVLKVGIIDNTDVNASAGIVRSKLALTGLPQFNEEPTGNIDGTNTLFTFAASSLDDALMLFYNGQLQHPGAGNDYTLAGAVATMLFVPDTNDRISGCYLSVD